MEREQADPVRKAAPETAEDAIRRNADAISRMDWEGGPRPGPFAPAIKLGQEVVPDARQDPTHPLRKGNQ